MDSTAQYLSLKALSKRSSLSIKTQRTFLYHQECPLPYYRMPRKILVRVDEFDDWLAKFRVHNPQLNLDAIVNDLISDL